MESYLNSVNAGSFFLIVALVLAFITLMSVIFLVKSYHAGIKIGMDKLQQAPKKENGGKPGFGAHATTAMFVGLCAAYIGSCIGKAIPREGYDTMPLVVALIAALCMAVFEYFIQKKGKVVLENFSLAASMLVAMAVAVVINMAI